MRVIMTGGGTGGHIYPAIAIADKFIERSDQCEILFVGTDRGLEKDLVPANGYPIRFVTVSGFNRKNLLKNLGVARDYLKGTRQAKKIIEDFKPDIVIGTGGYVCAPVIREAAEKGIRCYIQEQNAFPGMANKALEKYVNKVFLGFEEAGAYFKYPDKHVVTGNPVRGVFFDGNREDSRKHLEIPDDRFVLLAYGGSRGAERINRAMIEVIKRYNGARDVTIFFGTGAVYKDKVAADLEQAGIVPEDNIHIIEYLDPMETYTSAADLVVARSGAMAVSEITVCGKASILIPSPNVTGDHQTFNAKAVSDKGGAVLLKESDLTGERLFEEIDRLKNDREALDEMAAKSAGCAPKDAADIIYYTTVSDNEYGKRKIYGKETK